MAMILVVEDEPKLRELVRRYLEREDHRVVAAGTAAEAKRAIDRGGIDLVLLDLNLPDQPGEAIAEYIGGRVRVMMLTAKSSEEERIKGLELGADDYLSKPFSPRELVLRVNAVLRRSEPREPERGAVVTYGDLRIDQQQRVAAVSGRPVDLTPTEWALLAAMATTPGRVFTRSELIMNVRGYEFTGFERTVDSHIKNLRRKLESASPGLELIHTVVGVGYRFSGAAPT